MRKIGLLLLTPFLPLSYLIDLLFGDAVTGIKTTAKEKIIEHKKAWLKMWRGEHN